MSRELPAECSERAQRLHRDGVLVWCPAVHKGPGRCQCRWQLGADNQGDWATPMQGGRIGEYEGRSWAFSGDRTWWFDTEREAIDYLVNPYPATLPCWCGAPMAEQVRSENPEGEWYCADHVEQARLNRGDRRVASAFGCMYCRSNDGEWHEGTCALLWTPEDRAAFEAEHGAGSLRRAGAWLKAQR